MIRAISKLTLSTLLIAFVLGAAPPASEGQNSGPYFRRIATFPVFFNTCDGAADFNDCANTETVAEIVDVSEDGNTLIYTDSPNDSLGFVDITDPENPQPGGVLELDGEPTSVAVRGIHALAGVNTSESFTDPSGYLAVVHVPTQTVVREIELDGQPDSVAVSPNGRYAVVAIENERDEDAGDGRPPQSPPGFLVIVDLVGGNPGGWSTRTVDLVGIADKFPEDPEPEFVSINHLNWAVVTLQENNHIVIVRLRDGQIIREFSAGSVDLDNVDTVENDLIEPDSEIEDVEREPDGVTWIGPTRFATADEGDLDGGSRGFTIFQANGQTRFEAGNSLEHITMHAGHYPEARSENKGNEPEGIAFGRYGGREYLFVGSERSSVVGVYRMRGGRPDIHQVLPGSGVGPEGLLPIPGRNLFVVANETDAREDVIRSTLAIFRLDSPEWTYPTVYSEFRGDGTPIPWGALSALAADPNNPGRAIAVHDSFYTDNRVFVLDVSGFPAVITDEIAIREDGDPISVDPEGIAVRSNMSAWVATEGGCDPNDCSGDKTPNELIEVAGDGTVLSRVLLPAATDALQQRFGFEGVASVGTAGVDELVYVAFQREWTGDPANHVRIGRYEPATGDWTFFYYPIETPESPNGGWVGLSEIVAVDDTTFAVIERDNQGGPDARIKRIYSFSVAGLTPLAEGNAFPVVTKTLRADLIPDLEGDNGLVIEKVEGLTILANGDVLIVTDNDGVDDSSGETQMINLGPLYLGGGDS